MARLLRRLLLLAILGAATAAAIRALRSQRTVAFDTDGASAPRWPPLSETNGSKPAQAVPAAAGPSTSSAPASAEAAAPAPGGTTWVEPDGGRCPDGFPVKATPSGLFHVPGGQFYERSAPVRCYVSADAAAADGYRAAKR
jgi:hypothetical protein